MRVVRLRYVVEIVQWFWDGEAVCTRIRCKDKTEADLTLYCYQDLPFTLATLTEEEY